MKLQSKTAKALGVCALAVLGFGAGLSIPLLMERNSVESLDKIQTVQDILENKWYFSKEADDLETRLSEQAILGMTTLEEDPYTNYFDLEEAKAFSQSLAGTGVGIGISFYQNEAGQLVIREVYVGSTADKAGLAKGDIITKVGELETAGKDADTIIQTIKNHDGQKLKLELERDGNVRTVIVEPGQFDSTVSLEKDGDTGIITLSSFSELTGETFAQAVQRLEKSGIQNLVLDLRGNTGGYLSAAQEIANALLPADTVIFEEEDKNGTIDQVKTDKEASPATFENIVILQDGNTASASEVLAGALKQQLDNVTTVGTTTYGKGTVQTSIPFSDGTSIKYTVAKWLLPDGTSIHETGLAPDEQVEAEAVSTVPVYEIKEGETIEPDTVHEGAAAVQVFLDFLGYETDRADTYFSPASAAGLKQFQKDNGLKATGIVDAQTWQTLFDSARLKLYEEEDSLDAQKNAALRLLEDE